MTSPRIYLAIDNCFASKRWTAPSDWAGVISDLGLRYVEASADNEIDPLYSTPEVLADWREEVLAAQQHTGVQVVSLYSGHGTYSTLGLAHPDPRVRAHMREDWLKVMLRNTSALHAGLGFFCHAFNEATLHDPAAYHAAVDCLYDDLAEVARTAEEYGVTVGVEQMYTPHQLPWTIDSARLLLQAVTRRAQSPFYLTIDTGHQVGQRKFLRPDRPALLRALKQFRDTGSLDGCWLGPPSAYRYLREAAAASEDCQSSYLAQAEEEIARHPYLFAGDMDGDPYAWLSRLACYSPIIHLQQTDGKASAHRPFTDEYNRDGLIKPEKVLRAIAEAYAHDEEADLPPRCEKLYLTLEIFSGTADLPVDILSRLQRSVSYWRQAIPEDGLPLAELLAQ
ncbi:MAG TPA: TIM barrel protein [Armatimonadota bacterium]|jgi:sugar phosphate isomerase/epimerase